MSRKSNVETPRGVVEPVSDRVLARALGVSRSTILNWRRKGMWNSSIDAAVEWAAISRPKKGRPPVDGVIDVPWPTVFLNR
jgi:hypothetical protein